MRLLCAIHRRRNRLVRTRAERRVFPLHRLDVRQKLRRLRHCRRSLRFRLIRSLRRRLSRRLAGGHFRGESGDRFIGLRLGSFSGGESGLEGIDGNCVVGIRRVCVTAEFGLERLIGCLERGDGGLERGQLGEVGLLSRLVGGQRGLQTRVLLGEREGGCFQGALDRLGETGIE